MKLKYYMRGLGIGIVLTTLILSMTNTKGQLTDKEIMERAAKLGMVSKEQDNAVLEQVINDAKFTSAPTESPKEEATIVPTVSLSPTESLTPTVGPTAIPSPAPTATSVPTKIPEDRKETGNALNITFTIKSGMSSGQVAALLVDKGLIKDAEDFNQYIVKAGKASIIRVGTYSLPKQVSYKDIVTEITSK